jgi:ABC-type bacteriocin/lantibiotic exporters, contain an N-terminal double-glycine peptidase domain
MPEEHDNISTAEASNKNSNYLIPIPLCYQETEYTCGVACTQSILASYGIIYKQDVLSEMLKQKPLYGTDYHDIISFLQKLGFQALFRIDMNIDTLKEYINKKIAPVLLIQAWKEDEIDYAYDWRDSHYTIACGYCNDKIIFMDPYTLGHYTFISNSELISRWHAVDSSGYHYNNCALIISNENLPFIYNPEEIRHQE